MKKPVVKKTWDHNSKLVRVFSDLVTYRLCNMGNIAKEGFLIKYLQPAYENYCIMDKDSI